MSLPQTPDALLAAVVAGDRRALARLITVVEEQDSGATEALRLAFEQARGSHRIGVTGAPGAGKSTLTDRLISLVRSQGESVGVLAVDPTSPSSGGAVHGDRVRMQDHALDEGVYVRSMASRGHLGGLSEAAPKALVAMDAGGFDHILIETVGVGQDEVEVTSAADTVVVVLTPGWGDGIQAAKAGILEIGDIFVVNKADRPGVRDTVADLRQMLSLGPAAEWDPPIVETAAATGESITDLWDGIGRHREYLGPEGLEQKRAARRQAELMTALAAVYRRRVIARLETGSAASTVEAVRRGTMDPWSAAEELA